MSELFKDSLIKTVTFLFLIEHSIPEWNDWVNDSTTHSWSANKVKQRRTEVITIHGTLIHLAANKLDIVLSFLNENKVTLYIWAPILTVN